MVLHVYCAVSGGIPILYRFSGQGTKLSFSELAPLNGIQVFGKVHSVTFKSTEGKDFNVYWKNCTEKLSIILVSKYSIYLDGESILKSIFDALILTVGIDDLMNIKHIDRLKKEIRPSYPIIDEILKSVDEFSESTETVRLLCLSEVLPSVNSNLLQEKLDEWSESISSLFCCLTVSNKLVVATSAWWDLTASERSLLSTTIAINNAYTTVDIPVFLPIKSPKVAFRLVSCRLIGNVWVSALCGPTPSISDFELNSVLCWSAIIEHLIDIPLSMPSILSENMNTQNGIVGALLINYEAGNYLLLGTVADDKYSFDVLRIFYYQNVKEMLEENAKKDSHKICETYWYSENNKLYAIFNKPYVLCVMTTTSIPIPSVRSISKDMMDLIVNNKIFLC